MENVCFFNFSIKVDFDEKSLKFLIKIYLRTTHRQNSLSTDGGSKDQLLISHLM